MSGLFARFRKNRKSTSHQTEAKTELCPHCNSRLSQSLSEAVNDAMLQNTSFKIQCHVCQGCLMHMGYCPSCDYWSAYLGGGLPPGKQGPCANGCGKYTLSPQNVNI